MRIMAINARRMARRVDWIFHRVMNSTRSQNRMRAELVELRLDIFRHHITAMARVTIVRFIREIKQPRLRARVMRRMTILARIRRHSCSRRVRPWINADAVPRLVGEPMGRILPPVWRMTGHADGGCRVIANQKFSILIIMRVMARSALHLVIMVQPDLVRERGGIFQLAIGGHKCVVIGERNWVIVRKISAEIARPAGHGGHSALHLDCCRARRDHSNSHSPIVTA